MPEATIIILDNSNYSINGDYHPTRWLSQIDAAGLLINTKMEQSHETAMGIALSGGTQVEIACTPSTDNSKVNSYLYGVKLSGTQKLANVLICRCRLCRLQPSLSNIGLILILPKGLYVLLPLR